MTNLSASGVSFSSCKIPIDSSFHNCPTSVTLCCEVNIQHFDFVLSHQEVVQTTSTKSWISQLLLYSPNNMIQYYWCASFIYLNFVTSGDMLDNNAAVVGTINTSIGIVSPQLVFRNTVAK